MRAAFELGGRGGIHPTPHPSGRRPHMSGLPRYSLKYTMMGHRKAISSIKFSPDGQWIASASADKSIKIWQASNGHFDQTLEGHLQGISDISWSQDSRYLASGSDDKTVKIWDTKMGTCVRTLVGHSNFVLAVAFSPATIIVASGSFDESVKLWDIQSGKCLRTLPAHSDPVSGVAFSPDATLLCSSGYDGLCRLWDVTSGQCLKTFMDEANMNMPMQTPISHILFSPNSQYLLASTLDSCLKLWDISQGKVVKEYSHPLYKNETYCIFACMDFSQGAHIVAGSENGTVCIWDLNTQELVGRIQSSSSSKSGERERRGVADESVVVLAVDVHPSNGSCVTGALGGDKSLQLWLPLTEGTD